MLERTKVKYSPDLTSQRCTDSKYNFCGKFGNSTALQEMGKYKIEEVKYRKCVYPNLS